MCLFLTALLRDGKIGFEEYGIEIREFCVNFLWVVEAAEVGDLLNSTDCSCIVFIDILATSTRNHAGQCCPSSRDMRQANQHTYDCTNWRPRCGIGLLSSNLSKRRSQRTIRQVTNEISTRIICSP